MTRRSNGRNKEELSANENDACDDDTRTGIKRKGMDLSEEIVDKTMSA